MQSKVMLSVVVIAKNEEKNIRECLDSVKWADEIVVVDDNSTDKTVEISQEYTDKVFEKKMDIEGRHRNWAYAQAKHSWVFSLDADERVTPELKEQIIEAISNPGEFKGFAIPRRNYIGDYWVKHGGWYPSAQLKLFKKELFKWEEVEVHPRAFLQGPSKSLTADLIHYSYKDFEDFLNKMNRQTTWEAVKLAKSKKGMGPVRATRRTIDRFFRMFLRKKAYKDGFTGFVLSIFASFYQIISYAKYREIKSKDKLNQK